MVIGAVGYSIYVGGFFTSLVFNDISHKTTDIAWLVSCVTAGVGGLSGGLLWTSQGAFFAQNARLFSTTTKAQIEAVNNTFASIFATTFLGVEMITKLFATMVYLIIPRGWGAHLAGLDARSGDPRAPSHGRDDDQRRPEHPALIQRYALGARPRRHRCLRRRRAGTARQGGEVRRGREMMRAHSER